MSPVSELPKRKNEPRRPYTSSSFQQTPRTEITPAAYELMNALCAQQRQDRAAAHVATLTTCSCLCYRTHNTFDSRRNYLTRLLPCLHTYIYTCRRTRGETIKRIAPRPFVFVNARRGEISCSEGRGREDEALVLDG